VSEAPSGLGQARLRCALMYAALDRREYADEGSERHGEVVDAQLPTVIELAERCAGTLLIHEPGRLVARFPTTELAMEAATTLCELLRAHSLVDHTETAARIGLLYADCATSGGDIVGDCLNQAQVLSGHAAGGEVIVTADTLARLPEALRAEALPLQDAEVADAPGGLYAIAAGARLKTLIGDALDMVQLEPSHLLLTVNGERYEVTAADPVLVLGRSTTCDVMIDTGVVSRTHARIELRLGRFLLMDQSTNGSFVRTRDGREIYVKQDELPLTGQGSISLGRPSGGDQAAEITFAVTRSAVPAAR
jgi:hypothetical protein